MLRRELALLLRVMILLWVIVPAAGTVEGSAATQQFAPLQLVGRVQAARRRLAVINIGPAEDLQTAVDDANGGDVIVLADGNYTGNGGNVVNINKDITIRAANAGQAVLDGEDSRRVVSITGGTVVLEGLDITKGYVIGVSARLLNLL